MIENTIFSLAMFQGTTIAVTSSTKEAVHGVIAQLRAKINDMTPTPSDGLGLAIRKSTIDSIEFENGSMVRSSFGLRSMTVNALVFADDPDKCVDGDPELENLMLSMPRDAVIVAAISSLNA